VWAELLHGARQYERREERVVRVTRTLAPFRSLAFDDQAAQHYAAIRDELESRGELIGPYDLLIAAIAMAHQLTVVSHDAGFRRVRGLATEDWTV
jgi:tRNA(fMet)-specific endonuclease VapC